MKVNGPGPVQANAIRRSRKSGGGGGTGFSDQISANDAEPAAAGQVRGPNSLTPVDALIALQEVGDALTGRKRAMGRGRVMLDLLDQVRLGLLVGGIPRAKLGALVQAVKAVAAYAEANRDTLAELDVNPLFVLPEGQGVVAVDALIRKV